MIFKLLLLWSIILGPKCLVYSINENPSNLATSTVPVDTKGLKLFHDDSNGTTAELNQSLYEVKPLNINKNIIVFKLENNSNCSLVKHNEVIVWSRDRDETPVDANGQKEYPKQVSFHTKPNVVFIIFKEEYLGYMLLGTEWKHLLKKENQKPSPRRESLAPKEPVEEKQEVVEKTEADNAESAPAEENQESQSLVDPDRQGQQANEDVTEESDQQAGESTTDQSADADADASAEPAGQDDPSELANENDQDQDSAEPSTTADQDTQSGTGVDEGTTPDPNEADGATKENEDENDDNNEENDKSGDGSGSTDQDPSGTDADQINEADGTTTTNPDADGASGENEESPDPDGKAEGSGESADQDSSEGSTDADASATPTKENEKSATPDADQSSTHGEPLSTTTDDATNPVKLTGVELSLKAKKATTQFDYDKKGKVVTYTAKSGFGFSSVKTTSGSSCCNKKSTDIWEAANESEYATKVVLDGKGKKQKTVTIQLRGGSKKVFKKDGKNKGWNEESSGTEDTQPTDDSSTPTNGTNQSDSTGTTGTSEATDSN